MGSQAFSVRLSTKGHLVVPKEIRQRHGWTEETELVLEERGDGVLVHPARKLPETPGSQRGRGDAGDALESKMNRKVE